MLELYQILVLILYEFMLRKMNKVVASWDSSMVYSPMSTLYTALHAAYCIFILFGHIVRIFYQLIKVTRVKYIIISHFFISIMSINCVLMYVNALF